MSADDQGDPGAIFQPDGPINPSFMREAVRTLLRSLPLDDHGDSDAESTRRMHSALLALSTLRPRDEIEVMLGVQAVSAYHAAAASWRLGMNLKQPRGDSTRHVSTAASAARTFDTLLKALERRQAKALPHPDQRPAPRHWQPARAAEFVAQWEANCRTDGNTTPDPVVEWTPEAIALVPQFVERERIDQENQGLDIANTEGIRPDGSIVMPAYPTPNQKAYIARRIGLRIRREWAENQRKSINKYPKIRPLRTGDIVE